MGPMGNQLWSSLQFLPSSPTQSLLLSMFLNPSSSTLTKFTSLYPSIHLYPPLSLLFLISTFYFYPIRAPYTLSSLLPSV